VVLPVPVAVVVDPLVKPPTTPLTPDTALDTTVAPELVEIDAPALATTVVTGTNVVTVASVLFSVDPTLFNVVPTVDPVLDVTPATSDVTGVKTPVREPAVPPEVAAETMLLNPPALEVRFDASVVTGLSVPAVVPEVRLDAREVTGASSSSASSLFALFAVPATIVVTGANNVVPLPALPDRAAGRSDNSTDTGAVTEPMVLAREPVPVAPETPVAALPRVLPTPAMVVVTGVRSTPPRNNGEAVPPANPETTDVTGPSNVVSVPLLSVVPFAVLNSVPMPVTRLPV